MCFSYLFFRILAVEIDHELCKIAEYNFNVNHVTNVTIFRDDSKNFCRTFLKKQQSGELDYHVILVDPPRGGLDSDTLRLVTHYENIIYISCNPLVSFLKEYESTLQLSHEISCMALFDQFPYTHHIECGFHLTKRKLI